MLRAHGRSIAWLLAAALVAACAAAAEPGPPGGAAALPPFDSATALLVVAPHPDDETLCCAGVIQRVVRAGGRASVVWITSGDGSYLDLLLVDKTLMGSAARQRAMGTRRMREARTATALLGVAGDRQLFLGYPDGGVLALLTDHASVFTSHFTAADSVPYPDALFPGHAYTGASLERDFAAVLERVRPTLVLAPSPRDSHPDHRAVALLTLGVLAGRGELAALRCWIVHGGEGWPSPRELSPGLPLTRAPRLEGVPLAPFELTPAEEDLKLAAVRAYATQLTTLAPFLLAFVRTTESFSAAP